MKADPLFSLLNQKRKATIQKYHKCDFSEMIALLHVRIAILPSPSSDSYTAVLSPTECAHINPGWCAQKYAPEFRKEISCQIPVPPSDRKTDAEGREF